MLTWISPQQHRCQEVFSLDGVVSTTSAEEFQEVVHAFLKNTRFGGGYREKHHYYSRYGPRFGRS